MKTLFIILSFFFFLSLVCGNVPSTCDCVNDPFYNTLGCANSFVFQGKAVSTVTHASKTQWTFKVATTYKGTVASLDGTTTVTTSVTACPATFQLNKNYLVGVTNGSVSQCSVVIWSSVSEQAKNYLKEIAHGNGNFICGSVDPCSTPCGDNINWVCGSDGESYSSLCQLQQSSCFVAYPAGTPDGPPHVSPAGGDIASPAGGDIASPAGGDLVPASSERQVFSSAVTYVSTGCCTADFHTVCATDYRPLCASNGITYNDPCQIHAAECTANTILSFTSGQCCPKFCSDLASPICGTDGQTYPNACSMQVASCTAHKTITESHAGPCCVEACTASIAPVCGSNGVSYSSPCYLNLASCHAYPNTITVAHQGSCGTPDTDRE